MRKESKLTVNYIVCLNFLLKVFDGNDDSSTVVVKRLSEPIRTRFVRLLPLEWHKHISMRIEIYGCSGRVDPFERLLPFVVEKFFLQ